MLLEIFPFYNIWTVQWFDPGTTRMMGVLQRIAICYLVAWSSLLHSLTGNGRRDHCHGILLMYWALMTLDKCSRMRCDTISDPTM